MDQTIFLLVDLVGVINPERCCRVELTKEFTGPFKVVGGVVFTSSCGLFGVIVS